MIRKRIMKNSGYVLDLHKSHIVGLGVKYVSEIYFLLISNKMAIWGGMVAANLTILNQNKITFILKEHYFLLTFVPKRIFQRKTMEGKYTIFCQIERDLGLCVGVIVYDHSVGPYVDEVLMGLFCFLCSWLVFPSFFL